MKKIVIYLTIIALITIITVGSTYAYLSAATNSDVNGLATEGSAIKIIYSGGIEISGKISLSTDRFGGRNTTVNIRLAEDSVKVKANLKINIEQITPELASTGFKWEVYRNSETTPIKQGNFLGCKSGDTTKKCANGDTLYILNDYQLTTENTSFTVYVWVDGNMVGNEVIGATFKGTLAAESENYTGYLE